MSKRSLFWGQASGKLGEAVYYRAGGEQRTRTWIPKIKNPKSYSQALQRTKMINITSCFMGLKTVVDSFMKPSSAALSPFNQFVKTNFPKNRWVADKETAAYKEGQAGGFTIANGSLSIDTTLSGLSVKTLAEPEEQTGYLLGMTLPSFNVQFNRTAPTGYFGLYSGAEIYQAFVGTNNPYNLPSEFDITLVLGIQGNVNMCYYTFTCHCSANSTDNMHVVQMPVGAVPVTVAQLQQLLVVGDGDFTQMESSNPGTVNGATIIAINPFGSAPFNTAAEITNLAAIVISYKDANGKQSTASSIWEGQGNVENSNQYLPTGELGIDIIKQYETVSTTI